MTVPFIYNIFAPIPFFTFDRNLDNKLCQKIQRFMYYIVYTNLLIYSEHTAGLEL